MKKSIEEIYDDFLYDCYLANNFLTEEDWLYYGRERHHIEVPNRDNGLLTPLNSQDLTTYQHWIAGVLQSEVRQKICFAAIPAGVLPKALDNLRAKWQSEGNRGENNGMYGKTLSDKAKQIKSELNSGEGNPMYGRQWWHNPITGEHIANAECPGNGWVSGMSDEYKQKMSERLSGENNPRYGVKLSEEQKQRQREKIQGRKNPDHSERMSGEGNPMYGMSGELSPTYGLKGEKSPRWGRKQWVNEQGEKKFCKDCPGPGWQNGLKWKF